jgi:hypothetical protein
MTSIDPSWYLIIQLVLLESHQEDQEDHIRREANIHQRSSHKNKDHHHVTKTYLQALSQVPQKILINRKANKSMTLPGLK